MYVVVCYDIVNDRRRNRVMRRAREHLTRVQKSVFEGEVADERVQKLREVLLEEIDPAEDTIRIYRLCGRCLPATEIMGLGTYVNTDDADEII